MKMRIFDTRWIGVHGIGRFAYELYTRIPDFSAIDLVGSPARAIDPFVLGRYLRKTKPELFFSPGYNAPLGAPTPFLFCLHDLNHLAADESMSSLKSIYYERVVRPAISRANAVITVSEYSRDQICEWAEVSVEKVHNVGNGVSPEFVVEGPIMYSEPYFVHVGGAREHKNLRRIMCALKASKQLAGSKLICVGAKIESILDIAKKIKMEDRILCLQNVSDAKLAEIYRGAIALVFASLREGFGLPIVEAMACGCTVITSSFGAMKEVGGSASLFVNPKDIEEIREKMELVASDNSLRQALKKLGIERAANFTWEKTTASVKDVILMSR